MTRKRTPFQDDSTFGIGVPIDPLGNDLHYNPQNRVLPSQFSFMTMPMNCTFIKNTENLSDKQSDT